MTGGILASNGGVSSPGGPQLEWINAPVKTLACDQTAEIGGRIRMRADGGAAGATFDVEDGTAEPDLHVSAAITEASGGRQIVKTGIGTMLLSGTNQYTGATLVNGGTLEVSGSISGTSAVTVGSGATMELSGSLQASGNITNDGTMILTGSPVLSAGGPIINNGTIINQAPGYVLPPNLVNHGTILQGPAAPEGLTALNGHATVRLSWNASAGATGYVVGQASAAEGPYATLAEVSELKYTVDGLTNGTTYYFRVWAKNNLGNGAAAEVTGNPRVVASPRQTMDIGEVGSLGRVFHTETSYLLEGAGAGVRGTSDACRFVYQAGSGDCAITVRVDRLTAAGSGGQGGLMIRESLAPNARCVGVWVTPAGILELSGRNFGAGRTRFGKLSGVSTPRWLRLTRSGNAFYASQSADGVTWSQFGGIHTISMSSASYLGVATSSGVQGAPGSCELSSDAVTP